MPTWFGAAAAMAVEPARGSLTFAHVAGGLAADADQPRSERRKI